MKVYFTTSVGDIEKVRSHVDHIFKFVESHGHTMDRFNYRKDPALETQSDDEMIGSYKHIVNAIKSCDFMIAELTGSSTGAGFEISLALGEKKPVLVLYNETIRKNLPTPFRGNKNKLLRAKKYRNEQDIDNAIKYFFLDVQNLIDTKFILIIPPTIDRYLEWNAREKGLPKAEVTRTAIENMIQADSRYQEYLKDNGIE
jgi:nucleoside 2-deoxyribosyltransferase